MSMLAEKRSRVKWTLNPRGKLWQNDESKFGQKLMEKMGWAKGKGLGRNQQGDLDPVRVMYKQDSKGLGFKWSNDDWIAHKEDFNAILANLNVVTDGQVANPEPAATVSLEEKSKTSRSRVHYQKFTRGKDMSRYSEEDLKCILGERKKKQDSEQEAVPEPVEQPAEESETPEGEETNSHGVTTIKRGSINDYFAQKMAKFKGKAPKTVASDDDEERPSFGFGFKPDTDGEDKRIGFQVETDTVGLGQKLEGHGFEPEVGSKEKPNIFVNLLSQFETETTRKRKRRIEEIDNETNEILEKGKKAKKEVTEKPSVRFDDEIQVKYISDTSLEVKEEPRRKKAKREQESEAVEVVVAEVHQEVVESDLVLKKKKKKKKSSVDEEAPEDPPMQVAEEEIKAEKKKKKKKDKKEEVEGLVLEAEQEKSKKKEKKKETEEIIVEEEQTKSKKKKKKSKEEHGETETVASLENTSAQDLPAVSENETEVKKAKKKKKDKTKEQEESPVTEEVETTRKEKKKGQKDSEETEGIVVEEEQTKIKKKKKKSKEENSETETVASSDNISAQVAVENETLLSAVGESSKKKRKREESDLEVHTSERVELVMAKKLEIPDFQYVINETKPDKLRTLKETFVKVRFDRFAGSNLTEIAGYGK